MAGPGALLCATAALLAGAAHAAAIAFASVTPWISTLALQRARRRHAWQVALRGFAARCTQR